LVEDPEDTRPVFRGLRQIRDRLQECLPDIELKTLSMGMTNDFPIAIEEGATEVRIGRAIFG
jgi:PLP dependent protein